MKDTLILALPLVALIVVLLLIGYCERYTRRHRPNRRTRNGWNVGPAHPSFWNNDRRGHTECR